MLEEKAQTVVSAESSRHIISTLKQKVWEFSERTNHLSLDAPHDFVTLRDYLIIQEMQRTKDSFETLFSTPDITLEGIKKEFIKCCTERSEQNNGTALSFSALPQGDTNTLYGALARLIFSSSTLPELLAILSAKTNTVIKPALETQNLPAHVVNSSSRQIHAAMQLIPLDVIEESLSEQDSILLPEDLSGRLFYKHFMLDINDIKSLPFNRQIQFYDALESTHPAIHALLYNHNDALRALKNDIVLVKSKGQTPEYALKHMIKGLVLGGEKMTGEVYASKSAENAFREFNKYLNRLEHALKESLLSLKSVAGKTLKSVREDLEQGFCVETAALHIAAIVENTANKEVLTTLPKLKNETLSAIRQKYTRRHPLPCKEEGNVRLPEVLISQALSDVKINRANQLIILLLHFPVTLYDALLENINIDESNVAHVFDGLVQAFKQGLYNEQQLTYLIPALITHIERFFSITKALSAVIASNNIALVGGLLEKLEEKDCLEFREETYWHRNSVLQLGAGAPESLKIILDLFSGDERRALVATKRSAGNTLLHLAAETPECLRVLLDLFSEDERVALVATKDKGGETVLFLAAEIPGSLRVILDLIPAEERLRLVTTTNSSGNTVLHYAADTPDSLRVLLDLFSEDEQKRFVRKSNNDGETVLHYAASSPEALRLLLDLFSGDEQRALVTTKRSAGNTVLHLAARSPESLRLLLDLFSEDERRTLVTTKDNVGETVLHWAARGHESLRLLLDLFSEDERRTLVTTKDNVGKSVLHCAARAPESLRLLLDLFSEDERRGLVEKKDKGGETVLHLAARTSGSLTLVLELFPEEDRLKAVTKKNISGFTVFERAVYRPGSIRAIFSLLPEQGKFQSLKSTIITNERDEEPLWKRCLSESRLLQLFNDIQSPLLQCLYHIHTTNSERHAGSSAFFSGVSGLTKGRALTLDALFENETCMEVFNEVITHLKVCGENSYTTQLLNRLVLTERGDISDTYSVRLAFLEDRWRASNVLQEQALKGARVN